MQWNFFFSCTSVNTYYDAPHCVLLPPLLLLLLFYHCYCFNAASYENQTNIVSKLLMTINVFRIHEKCLTYIANKSCYHGRENGTNIKTLGKRKTKQRKNNKTKHNETIEKTRSKRDIKCSNDVNSSYRQSTGNSTLP